MIETARFLAVFGQNAAESVASIRRHNSGTGFPVDIAFKSSLGGLFGTRHPRLSFASSGDGTITVAVLSSDLRSNADDSATQCDAESILSRYRAGEPSFLDTIRGSFSIALFDSARRTAVLAIDRLGCEALFFCTLPNGTLVAASDLDLIEGSGIQELTISQQAIFDYCYFHAVPSPLTIFRDVHKLPPAHRLVVNGRGEKLERYWMPTFEERDSKMEGPLAGELMDHLRTAVERRVGGPGTGAFLSGGLDSSTVAGLLAETLDSPARAISVGFDVEGYDETYYARIAARHFGLAHDTHIMTPDEIADSIPLIAEGYDEPFGNSSVIPSYLCAVAAKEQGIETLLAGDGGDELFAGNTRYAKQLLFESYFKVPRLLRRTLLDPVFAGQDRRWLVGPLRKIRRYIEQAHVPLPHRLQTFNLLEMRGAEAIFSQEFLATVDTAHPQHLLESEYMSPVTGDPLDRMLFSDWRFTLADNDLRKVKRTCELAGVEVRFPFLDDDLVDFSTRVPSELKLRRRKLRHFYKRALTDYLPAETISKEKHGFGLPFGEWLRTNQRLQEMVYDALQGLDERGIFRSEFIRALIDDHREGHASFYGNMVWVLAMLEWWLRAHRSD